LLATPVPTVDALRLDLQAAPFFEITGFIEFFLA